MEESIAGPVRELDKAVPLSRIEPFQFTPNRRRGRLTELCFGKLRRDLGMAQRVAVVPLLLRHDFGMARSVITVCVSDDLPSTLTNQSASLYDEFPYGLEHARLRTRNSRYSVSGGQSRPGWTARIGYDRPARASPSFEPDIIEIADARGVRVVAVAEHRDINQTRRRRILPGLGIDASEVDLLVKPTSTRSSPASATKCGKPPMYLYSPGFNRAPDHVHCALLAMIRRKPKKQPRRVIVACPRAFVERAADRQFDVPPPREDRVSRKVDVDMPKQHRSAVMGFEPHARHTVFDREGHAIDERVQNFRCRQPEGSGSSEKLCPKSITVTTGPPSGFSTSPRPPKSASRSGRPQLRVRRPQSRRIGLAKLFYAGLQDFDRRCVTLSHQNIWRF
jgi:hypothetical protein